MPALPTFTVTDATATRLMKAFEGQVNPESGLPLAPSEAYRRWLRQQLVQYVSDKEEKSNRTSLETAIGT